MKSPAPLYDLRTNGDDKALRSHDTGAKTIWTYPEIKTTPKPPEKENETDGVI